MMTETEFNRLMDATLLEIEQALDACGTELEFDTSADILTIDFDNGTKIIVNRQTPNRELWVAAKSGGYHFRHDADQWLDTRSGRELFEVLAICISEQAGEQVALTRPRAA